ncbi:MAG: polysaccharide biosynthesis protein [Dyadobacter sp.]|uniref:UDP-N-acetylglucosamine 4,6-dehydratase family protein n=1 Tax=Dyadobacter sp. TaxID=1914288 RepID=UPI003264581A
MQSHQNKTVSVQSITPFNLEDLLGRDPIVIDQANISNQLLHKIILITGAAGSIGSELATQIASYNPDKLFLLDQSETHLHELDLYLKASFPYLEIHSFVANVTDAIRMNEIISSAQPEIIFHAAAYKHVPIMEKHPYEAIKTNVLGTQILADLALAYRVGTFILISTDKAVKPASVMGATKRMAEIYLQYLGSRRSGNTRFIITRFGNVLGSNGSFIPIFKKQIAAGGPITVTHPDVTRYIMTVSEACQLVLEAGAVGKNGQILFFDMGNPVRIVDIANRMIDLSGLQPEKDIRIEYTGMRPGEKLYEELLCVEGCTTTDHPKIRIASVAPISFIHVEKMKTLLTEVLQSGQTDQMVALLKLMIPEYISDNSDFQKLDKKGVSNAK